MRRRVVVTGMGLVTPLGAELETVWQRLLRGESGVGYITLFDASNFPTKIAAEVQNWDLSDVGEDPQAIANDYLPALERGDGTRFTLVASPVQFDGAAPALRPAPECGQHTEEVLLSLGMTWEELAALKESGAIS